MRVEVVSTDDAAAHRVLDEAAAILRAGGLVAFPTETVYGLGANALDSSAVARIYEAKGRPPINPVIVHVATVEDARALSSDWTPAADAIARAFWPGPITIVVRKTRAVPDIVTAGGDTVGLRVPAHPIALRLLERAGVPVAAPSANLSTQVSPTTAQHVAAGLGGRVDLILDGGPTSVGIESTVVDATGSVARILRPGMISREDVARVVSASDAAPVRAEPVPRSPGQLGRHYAPRALVRLFDASERERVAGEARAAQDRGARIAAMTLTPLGLREERVMPSDPEIYARALYATLHALDDSGCEVVWIERPPERPEWIALRDRLARAAE